MAQFQLAGLVGEKGQGFLASQPGWQSSTRVFDARDRTPAALFLEVYTRRRQLRPGRFAGVGNPWPHRSALELRVAIAVGEAHWRLSHASANTYDGLQGVGQRPRPPNFSLHPAVVPMGILHGCRYSSRFSSTTPDDVLGYRLGVWGWSGRSLLTADTRPGLGMVRLPMTPQAVTNSWEGAGGRAIAEQPGVG